MGYITKDSCGEVQTRPCYSRRLVDHNLTCCPLSFLGPLRKCVRYLGKRHDKSMKLGFLSSVDDLIHGDFPRVVPVLDVLCDAGVEQDGLLGHDANLGTQEGHVDTSGDVAINQLQRAIDFAISEEQ